MNLKKIHQEAIPRALELAERYRLLNEPDQAVSICRDILETDAAHQSALKTLLLALSDGFGQAGGPGYQEADAICDRLKSEYDRAYYRGVVYERWARSKLKQSAPAYLAGEWVRRAMALYEEAERSMPSGDDSAVLRWNACARLVAKVPQLLAESDAHELHLGD